MFNILQYTIYIMYSTYTILLYIIYYNIWGSLHYRILKTTGLNVLVLQLNNCCMIDTETISAFSYPVELHGKKVSGSTVKPPIN